MTFEEYTAKPEFQENAKKIQARRSLSEKITLFFVLPLFLLGAVFCVVEDLLDAFAQGSLLFFILGVSCCGVATVTWIILSVKNNYSSSVDFAPAFFRAERLLVQEKLSAFFEGVPREGDIVLYYDFLSTDNQLSFSLDGAVWTTVDVTPFCEALRSQDVCAILCIGYLPRLEAEQRRGFFPQSVRFRSTLIGETTVNKPKRGLARLMKNAKKDLGDEEGDEVLIKKGKLTSLGKTAIRAYQKALELDSLAGKGA